MSNPTSTSCGESAADELIQTGTSAIDGLIKYIDRVTRAGIEMNPVLQAIADAQRRSSCEIPPPCWLPRSLGEICSVVCEGGAVTLRVRVTNCQPQAGQVRLSVASADLLVEIEPDNAVLGPMERHVFNVKLTVPANACKKSRFEALLWVHGCNAHYLRWALEVSDTGGTSCHELDVEDCPDYVHHWYDHFYCVRPCFSRPATSIGDQSRKDAR